MNSSKLESPLFSFGVIADVQYADLDDGQNYAKTRIRYYRNSMNHLKDAVKNWNSMCPKPSFILQLGDLIDGHNKKHEGMKESSWRKMIEALDHFDGKVFHTFGNHDYYNFSHKEIAEMLPAMTLSGSGGAELMENRKEARLRYTFRPHEKYLFIVLDTYELSMLGYDKDDEEYKKGEAELKSVNTNEDINNSAGLTCARYVEFNGALGPEQINWLDGKLAGAEASNQKVIIFGHVQLIGDNDCQNVIWDSEEVLDVLHKYQCVVAVFSGHDHGGSRTIDNHGIHHIVMPGVVEMAPDDQAYATVHVHEDRLELVGRGSLVPSTTIPTNR